MELYREPINLVLDEFFFGSEFLRRVINYFIGNVILKYFSIA
jgi:hypothetical protein